MSDFIVNATPPGLHLAEIGRVESIQPLIHPSVRTLFVNGPLVGRDETAKDFSFNFMTLSKPQHVGYRFGEWHTFHSLGLLHWVKAEVTFLKTVFLMLIYDPSLSW